MKKHKKLITILLVVILLMHGPIGGFCTQFIVSIGSYIGICIGSIFNETLQQDMSEIGYNPFNSDEQKVLTANSVSFYKGIPFYKTQNNRSGSFCAVLYSDKDNADDVRHESGHNLQQLILGPITFLALIGAPSFFELSNREYYDRPWEITADIFGGVESRTHTKEDIDRGNAYLVTSFFTGPAAYLFLIEEL